MKPTAKQSTLITGDPIPDRCPRCNAPRWMVDAEFVAFVCHSRVQFFRAIPNEPRRNPKVKQTLRCLAACSAGGWKRAAA
jgi:hypothetical protein